MKTYGSISFNIILVLSLFTCTFESNKYKLCTLKYHFHSSSLAGFVSCSCNCEFNQGGSSHPQALSLKNEELCLLTDGLCERISAVKNLIKP